MNERQAGPLKKAWQQKRLKKAPAFFSKRVMTAIHESAPAFEQCALLVPVWRFATAVTVLACLALTVSLTQEGFPWIEAASATDSSLIGFLF